MDDSVKQTGKKRGRPFTGQPGPGRPKGSKNKTNADVRAFVDDVFARIPGGPEALAAKLLKNDKTAAFVFLKLLEFRYGKPAQSVLVEDARERELDFGDLPMPASKPREAGKPN